MYIKHILIKLKIKDIEENKYQKSKKKTNKCILHINRINLKMYMNISLGA